jgi:hypothetical protein
MGGPVGQVEHEVIPAGCRWGCIAQPDDLQVNRAARQAEDRSVKTVAIPEGLKDWEPDDVPIEPDGFLVPRAQPRNSQRANRQVLWPARVLCHD